MFKSKQGKYVVSSDKRIDVESNAGVEAGDSAPADQAKSERKWTVILSSLVAALGSVSFGYGLGYSSAAVTQLEKPNGDLHLSKESLSWFSVSYFLYYLKVDHNLSSLRATTRVCRL